MGRSSLKQLSSNYTQVTSRPWETPQGNILLRLCAAWRRESLAMTLISAGRWREFDSSPGVSPLSYPRSPGAPALCEQTPLGPHLLTQQRV